MQLLLSRGLKIDLHERILRHAVRSSGEYGQVAAANPAVIRCLGGQLQLKMDLRRRTAEVILLPGFVDVLDLVDGAPLTLSQANAILALAADHCQDHLVVNLLMIRELWEEPPIPRR